MLMTVRSKRPRGTLSARGITNVVITTPRAIPEGLAFSAVYSNPPTRIGKSALLSLLTYWLSRLDGRALAYLVIKKSAGADSIAHSLGDAGFWAQKIVARRGYRIVEVRNRCTEAQFALRRYGNGA